MDDSISGQTTEPRSGSNLVVSLTDPDTLKIPVPSGVWFASGLDATQASSLSRSDGADQAGDQMARLQKDASLVFVELIDGCAARVVAWRGLLAGNEIYSARLPDGGHILSDHFRNVVSALPQPMREMSTEVIAEHYVAGWVYDGRTHSVGVGRLANGDRLNLDLPSGEISQGLFDRIESVATDEPEERHLDRLDNALEAAVSRARADSDAAVAFSGGVDSTLLLSYMGSAGTALTMVPDTPEFGDETEYARDAAELLGRTMSRLELREVDYLQLLEQAIEKSAMPIISYVTPMTSVLYAQDAQSYLLGEGADSVFGSGRGIRRIASALSGRPARAVLSALEAAPGSIGGRARQIGGYAALFAAPTSSSAGVTGRTLEYYGDTSLARRAFGHESIDRVFDSYVSAVLDRVSIESPESDRFHRHIEMYQWRNIFSDLSIPGRHFAQAEGKRVVMPFVAWNVVAEHLKVPAKTRYVKGLSGKWMLKKLLSRRVPEYRVNKRKLATGLPFERFYASGPLANVWSKYDVPDGFPAELRQDLVTKPSPVTWNAINYAIWYERVVRNPELKPHPASVSSSWPIYRT